MTNKKIVATSRWVADDGYDITNPEIEYTNPITNEKETIRRNLIIVRVAQWTHYISSEINRLNRFFEKCNEIHDIHKTEEKEQEEKLKKETEEINGKS